jgi:hypothetical protein
MGYNIRDLEKAGRSINNHIDRRSQERGEELANRIIHSTSRGRGLWFIILWPAWLLIAVFSGVFLMKLAEKFNVLPPLSWLGMIGGLIIAHLWYMSDFTIRHPFRSSVLGYFGISLAVIILGQKIGLNL